jgi:hypothetical protein
MGYPVTVIILRNNGSSKKINFHENFTKLQSKYRPQVTKLYRYNLRKYQGVPPSYELVRKVLKDSNLNCARFEFSFSIPITALQKYLMGERGLPAHYWHLFYEFGKLEKFYSNFRIKTPRKPKPKVATPVQTLISDKHKSTIDAIRSRIT